MGNFNLKEYQKEYQRKRQKEKPESYLIYLENTKEKRKEYQKIYREKNKEKAKEHKRNHYLKNKDKIIKRERDRFRNKYNNDTEFKIKSCLRRRLLNSIKNNSKSGSAIELLGCSIKEFKEYISSKFKDGMTWDNYGVKTWHIDHIKPCASFDLTKEEEQKQCFHYTNMQPLWAFDNYSKGKKHGKL